MLNNAAWIVGDERLMTSTFVGISEKKKRHPRGGGCRNIKRLDDELENP